MFRADLYYRLAVSSTRAAAEGASRRHPRARSYFLERHGHASNDSVASGRRRALTTIGQQRRELERMMERTLALARHARSKLATSDWHSRGSATCCCFDDAQRHVARMGESYVRLVLERSGRNKRKALPRARDQLSHVQAYLRYAHRLQVATCTKHQRNIRQKARRTHSAQRDRRMRGTAGAEWGHAHVQFISP